MPSWRPQLADLQPALGFLEYPDDLFLGESLALPFAVLRPLHSTGELSLLLVQF